jgi:hypothetical protein
LGNGLEQHQTSALALLKIFFKKVPSLEKYAGIFLVYLYISF